MTTIKVFGKDSSSAMEEISNKLGSDAFILSTKSLEKGVEIEASNDPIEIKKATTLENEKKITFMNEMKKRLPEKVNLSEKKINKFNRFKYNNSFSENEKLEQIQNSLNNLIKDIRGMFITDNLSLSKELGQSTSIRLYQSNFDRKIINDFSPSYEGLSDERGRSAFMRAISEKLTETDYSIYDKKISFVFGSSGVGKTTLVAKLAAKFSQDEQNVVLVSLDTKNNQQNDKLSSFSRILNIPNFKTHKDEFFDKTKFINDHIIVDVSLNNNDFVEMAEAIIENFGERNINSLLVIPGGSNRKFISNQANIFKKFDPIVSLSKLDECEISSEEISEFVLNNLKISFLSGSNSILNELIFSNKDILMQYLVENC